jgi:exonuclease VII small subunit
MTKPSTEQLKKNLQDLLNKYNEALQIQAQCKEQIIAVQAVIQDREDGDTNDSNSTDSED